MGIRSPNKRGVICCVLLSTLSLFSHIVLFPYKIIVVQISHTVGRSNQRRKGYSGNGRNGKGITMVDTNMMMMQTIRWKGESLEGTNKDCDESGYVE